mmetsp:Transcript_4599/g.6509  ORF Transcript_4599/g.6509 Transcript_4599/m.6509 type:complete len:246 (-) Transcript_4599:678-1415(-)
MSFVLSSIIPRKSSMFVSVTPSACSSIADSSSLHSIISKISLMPFFIFAISFSEFSYLFSRIVALSAVFLCFFSISVMINLRVLSTSLPAPISLYLDASLFRSSNSVENSSILPVISLTSLNRLKLRSSAVMNAFTSSSMSVILVAFCIMLNASSNFFTFSFERKISFRSLAILSPLAATCSRSSCSVLSSAIVSYKFFRVLDFPASSISSSSCSYITVFPSCFHSSSNFDCSLSARAFNSCISA